MRQPPCNHPLDSLVIREFTIWREIETDFEKTYGEGNGEIEYKKGGMIHTNLVVTCSKCGNCIKKDVPYKSLPSHEVYWL